jgi:hypothetical protein
MPTIALPAIATAAVAVRSRIAFSAVLLLLPCVLMMLPLPFVYGAASYASARMPA